LDRIWFEEPYLNLGEEQYKKSLGACWIEQLIKTFPNSVSANTVVRACLVQQNQWSFRVISNLLPHLPNNSFSKRVQQLVTIKSGYENKSDNNGGSNEECVTVVDNETIQVQLSKTAELDSGCWELVIDDYSIKFGLDRNGELPNLDLPKELDDYKLAIFLISAVDKELEEPHTTHQHKRKVEIEEPLEHTPLKANKKLKLSEDKIQTIAKEIHLLLPDDL